MRFTILVLISYLIITPVFGQQNNTASVNNDKMPSVSASDELLKGETVVDEIEKSDLPDGIMLRGTTMVQVKNGIVTPLERDVILINGTRIRKDGYIFRKHKPKMLLNDDEYIDTSGKIHPINKINSFTN